MEKKSKEQNNFKKIKNQEKHISNDIKIKELKNSLLNNEKKIHNIKLRKLAEIENIKKSFNMKEENIRKIEKEIFFKKILLIIDSFEKILLLTKKLKIQEKPEIQGLNLTFKSLLKIIHQYDIKIEGKKNEIFNHNLHQVVSRQSSNIIAPNHIISVIQKGYTFKKVLLRKAKVIISKKL